MEAMPERIATILVDALYLYAAVGLVFGLVFVLTGVSRVDAQAKGTSVLFRLLILPGCAAFWPLLLQRWLRGQTEPPEERNPHS